MANSPEYISLSARLDLAEVKNLATALLAFEPQSNVLIDATDVTHFGSLCAQTLISGALRAQAGGGSYKLVNLSDRAKEQLDCMGITENILTEGLE